MPRTTRQESAKADAAYFQLWKTIERDNKTATVKGK